MFSIQHCSVAAICVASDCQNHSHCDAQSQPGDTIPRRVIGMAGPRLRKTARSVATTGDYRTRTRAGIAGTACSASSKLPAFKRRPATSANSSRPVTTACFRPQKRRPWLRRGHSAAGIACLTVNSISLVILIAEETDFVLPMIHASAMLSGEFRRALLAIGSFLQPRWVSGAK